MKYGSLFSGIGGFDIGLDRAGMECAWQVEIEPTCVAVLGHYWPQVRRYADVTQVGGDLEPVDLVCGGFPCQDISVAGRRAGLAGERSGLWFEFHRVLATVRPRWVVIENVDGLLSSGEPAGGDLAIILRGLADLGYLGAYRVLDAQYFGLAQRRKRVFIVGSLGSPRAAAVLLESESLRGDSPPSRKARPPTSNPPVSRALARVGGGDDPGANKGAPIVVAGTLRGGAAGGPSHGKPSGMDKGPFAITSPEDTPEPFIYQHASGGGDDPKDSAQTLRAGAEHSYQVVYDARGNGPGDRSNTLTGDHLDRITDYTPVAFRTSGYGAQVDEDVVPPLQASDAHLSNQVAGVIAGGDHGTGRRSEFDPNLVYWDGGDIADTLDASMAAKQQMMPEKRRMAAVLAPSQTAANDPPQLSEVTRQVEAVIETVGHPRRLTPTECERLQGFPDDWTNVAYNGKRMSDSARYRMLGNAVAVPVAEWIARRIIEEERQ